MKRVAAWIMLSGVLSVVSAVPVRQCINGTPAHVCQMRGDVDLGSLNTEFSPASDFESERILKAVGDGFFSTHVIDNEKTLVFSLPFGHVTKDTQRVEELSIRIGPDGKPIGVSVSLKPALGSPLLKNMIPRVVRPHLAAGPIISEKESAPPTMQEEAQENPENEPSFLRKYWWIIVGAMLLSSFFGPNESGTPGNSSANSK